METEQAKWYEEATVGELGAPRDGDFECELEQVMNESPQGVGTVATFGMASGNTTPRDHNEVQDLGDMYWQSPMATNSYPLPRGAGGIFSPQEQMLVDPGLKPEPFSTARASASSAQCAF